MQNHGKFNLIHSTNANSRDTFMHYKNICTGFDAVPQCEVIPRGDNTMYFN